MCLYVSTSVSIPAISRSESILLPDRIGNLERVASLGSDRTNRHPIRLVVRLHDFWDRRTANKYHTYALIVERRKDQALQVS